MHPLCYDPEEFRSSDASYHTSSNNTLKTMIHTLHANAYEVSFGLLVAFSSSIS